MGILNLASYKSLCRGYDYYNEGKVALFLKTDDGKYDAKVKGSGQMMYDVHIDSEHPRKSKCNCPFADGTRKICKHMVAVFLTAYPDEAKCIERQIQIETEEDERLTAIDEDLFQCVKKMSEDEVRAALYDILSNMLDEGRDWEVESFIGCYSDREDDEWDEDEDLDEWDEEDE